MFSFEHQPFPVTMHVCDGCGRGWVVKTNAAKHACPGAKVVGTASWSAVRPDDATPVGSGANRAVEVTLHQCTVCGATSVHGHVVRNHVRVSGPCAAAGATVVTAPALARAGTTGVSPRDSWPDGAVPFDGFEDVARLKGLFRDDRALAAVARHPDDAVAVLFEHWKGVEAPVRHRNVAVVDDDRVRVLREGGTVVEHRREFLATAASVVVREIELHAFPGYSTCAPALQPAWHALVGRTVLVRPDERSAEPTTDKRAPLRQGPCRVRYGCVFALVAERGEVWAEAHLDRGVWLDAQALLATMDHVLFELHERSIVE